MNRSIIRHSVCRGCNPGEVLTKQVDATNEVIVASSLDWEDLTLQAVIAAMPGSTSEEYEDAIRNSIRKTQQKVVCGLAGEAACAGLCQAKVIPAYPEQPESQNPTRSW